MKRETFHLELITPCFCAGANQAVAEIRAPPFGASFAGGFAHKAATHEMKHSCLEVQQAIQA